MATFPPLTSPPLELATDFEQWFAKKVKAVVSSPSATYCNVTNLSQSIQANVAILLSPEWKVVINQQFCTTLNKAIPAYEFRLFPYLPKELRVKIWKFGAFVPRVIHLHPDSNAKPLSICRQRAPTILHACHESRTVALPQFKVLFDPNLDLPRTHSQTIYVQPEVGTYYVRDFIGQPFV